MAKKVESYNEAIEKLGHPFRECEGGDPAYQALQGKIV